MTTYNLHYYETYRGDHSYKFSVADGSDDECESDCYGSFTVPASDSGKLRIFVVNTNDCEYMLEDIYVTNADTTDQAKNVLLELHSHINGCLPFNVTGMSVAYKEEGYYPDPIAVTNPDILRLDPEKINKPAVAIVVDDMGEIIDYMSINPCQ